MTQWGRNAVEPSRFLICLLSYSPLPLHLSLVSRSPHFRLTQPFIPALFDRPSHSFVPVTIDLLPCSTSFYRHPPPLPLHSFCLRQHVCSMNQSIAHTGTRLETQTGLKSTHRRSSSIPSRIHYTMIWGFGMGLGRISRCNMDPVSCASSLAIPIRISILSSMFKGASVSSRGKTSSSMSSSRAPISSPFRSMSTMWSVIHVGVHSPESQIVSKRRDT